MRTISVRLDERSDGVLRRLCEREGLSQSEVVKAALARWEHDSRPSPHALAERLGLIGCFDSGVGDLAEGHSRYLKERLSTRHRGGRYSRDTSDRVE